MRKVEYLNVSSNHASIFSLFSGTLSKGKLDGMTGISMGIGHEHRGDMSGFAVSSLFVQHCLVSSDGRGTAPIVGKSRLMMPKSIMTSMDKKNPRACRLTYTIVAHDRVSLVGEQPDSRRNTAPSIVIGDLFAASKSMVTGIRSDMANPAARKSFRDQRQDCAPVSVIPRIRDGRTDGLLRPNDL